MSISYVTQRLAIVSKLSPGETILQAEQRHGKYFHIFNLSGDEQLFESHKNRVTYFKNRSYPFSIKESLLICSKIHVFLRNKNGNVAILYDPKVEFALYVLSCYLVACRRCDDIIAAHRYCCKKVNLIKELPHQWLINFQHFLTDWSGKLSPPVLLVRSLKVTGLKAPVFQIMTEGRFQELSSSYRHNIEPQLQEYYFGLDKPRYYDMQPATEHLLRPALIFGDFSIHIYEYSSLKHEHYYTVAHNTILLHGKNKWEIPPKDIYCVGEDGQKIIGKDFKITLEFDQFCQCGLKQDRCFHCQPYTRHLKKQYGQMQQLINVISIPSLDIRFGGGQGSRQRALLRSI